MGLKRNPRSLGHLKSCYREFKSRISSFSVVPASSTKPSESRIISKPENQKPLDTGAQTHVSGTNAPSPNFSPSARYAVMLAPPVPGRRPEKLRFDLSLLFTEEGKEYSIQEARARFMGLLGRKWGPPPAPELPLNRSKVDKTTTLARRTVLMGEPTVTINTKEALADVFGMYNSPDKTRRIVPGSKHAPLKKVEPITPVVQRPQIQARTPANSEFATHATKTPNSGKHLNERV
jgi:checkpoint serine/threonine-protein kinase